MTGHDDTAFDDLVLAIYRAAEDPAEWPSCLDRIRIAMNGSGATLMHQDAASPGRSVEAHTKYAPDDIARYREYYARIDPWGQALNLPALTPGQVIDGRELVPDDVVRKSEFFADFGRHVGSAYSIVTAAEASESRASLVIVARAAGQTPFDDADRRLLSRLGPHLRQAFRLHRRVAAANGARAIACDALDRLSMGVVLVDRAGRPLFVNAAAQRIAGRGKGFAVGRDGIEGIDTHATRRVACAIRQVTDADARRVSVNDVVAFTIPAGADRRPLRVVVVPAGHREGGLGADVGASAAVFVGDPDRRVIDEPDRLEGLFGFTSTEALIATHIVNGDSLTEIAVTLGLKIGTVRWYAKQILQKAGVHTQAQLVSLLLRAPSILR